MKYDDDAIRSHSEFGKFFIIPQDPHDRELLNAVDRKTRSDVDLRYNFIVDYDWMLNTVTNVFFEVMVNSIKFLFDADRSAGSDGIGFKFYDLFSAVITNKVNEHAEKEGNLNIYFETAERVTELIENGIPPVYSGPHVSIEERFLTDDPAENEFMAKLDANTAYELSKSHGITIPSKLRLVTCAIAYSFFENLFIELLVRAAAMKPEEGEEAMVSVNFNDNIEIHCVLKDGAAQIMMRPGMNVKMLVKSDEYTENTMGDLDD